MGQKEKIQVKNIADLEALLMSKLAAGSSVRRKERPAPVCGFRSARIRPLRR